VADSDKYPKAGKFTGVYYAFLSIMITLVIQSTLYAFGISGVIPFFQGLLLALVIAFCFGVLFGKLIVKTTSPFRVKCFLWGVILILTSLPFYALGLTFLFYNYHPSVFGNVSSFGQYGLIYVVTLAYCAIVGVFLAILSGMAAIYLRSTLYPGYLAFINKQEQKNTNDLKNTHDNNS
jgi:hypothetical protein